MRPILALLSILASPILPAATVTLTFQGTVTVVNDPHNHINGVVTGDVVNGSRVTGTLSYDTSVPPCQLVPNSFAAYCFTAPPSGLTITVQSSVGSLIFNTVYGQDIGGYRPFEILLSRASVDVFSAGAIVPNATFPPATPALGFNSFTFGLISRDPSFLPSDSLPATLDLSKTQDALPNSVGNSSISSQVVSGNDSWTIQFRIDQLVVGPSTTGTIIVTSTPPGAGFQLVGPGATSYSGTTPFSTPLAPPGDYTITWAPGTTPVGAFLQTLTAGGTIVFVGTQTTCTPPRLVFPDATGAAGFADIQVSNTQWTPEILNTNVRVVNYIHSWMGVASITPTPANSVQLAPNLNAGIEGVAATFNVVPPCSGFSIFTSCPSPGAAAWTAAFCSAGNAEIHLQPTLTSATLTLTDILLSKLTVGVVSIATAVNLSDQLYTNVPAFKAAADCLANPNAGTIGCVSQSFLTLARDSTQRQKIVTIFGSAGINIGVGALVGALAGASAGAIQAAGDLIAMYSQTAAIGHLGIEVLRVYGQ